MTLNYHLTVLSNTFILSADVIEDSLHVLKQIPLFVRPSTFFIHVFFRPALQLSMGHYYNRRIILQRYTCILCSGGREFCLIRSDDLCIWNEFHVGDENLDSPLWTRKTYCQEEKIDMK